MNTLWNGTLMGGDVSSQVSELLKTQPEPWPGGWTEIQPTQAGFNWAVARDGEVEMIEVLEWGKARTMYSHDSEGFALSCWSLFMAVQKPEDPRIANGDPQCPECQGFKVEPKKTVAFQRGRPHREEYSEVIHYYECECGHQFEP